MPRVAFAPDVFTWPADEPQLIGGRCPSCAAVTFPLKPSCPRCGTPDRDRHLLPRRGTLWTWTTQDFLPKEPYASGETFETFRPYGVGLVQLGDELRVEARLTESDPEALDFGTEVELVIVPFRVDDDGTEIVTYAFLAPMQGVPSRCSSTPGCVDHRDPTRSGHQGPTVRRCAVETMIGIGVLLAGIGVLWVCFAIGVYFFTRTGREGIRIQRMEADRRREQSREE